MFWGATGEQELQTSALMFYQELPVCFLLTETSAKVQPGHYKHYPKAQGLNLGNDTHELRTVVTPRGKALERLTPFPHIGAKQE